MVRSDCLRSSPLYCPCPDPHLVLMGWRPEPDPYGLLGPGNGMARYQLLYSVFPDDPGLHRLRDGCGGDCELPQLLGLRTSGLPLGNAWTFGHIWTL